MVSASVPAISQELPEKWFCKWFTVCNVLAKDRLDFPGCITVREIEIAKTIMVCLHNRILPSGNGYCVLLTLWCQSAQRGRKVKRPLIWAEVKRCYVTWALVAAKGFTDDFPAITIINQVKEVTKAGVSWESGLFQNHRSHVPLDANVLNFMLIL